MDLVAPPTFKERVDPARPPIPSIQGLRPLEGREVGGWETHRLVGSPGGSHGPATPKC